MMRGRRMFAFLRGAVLLLAGLGLGFALGRSGVTRRAHERSAAWPCLPAGFQRPEPDLAAQLRPRVLEYFYLRKRAVLQGDLTALWQRYPALAQGYDPVLGVNAERDLPSAYARDGRPIDGDVHLTAYGPWLVRRRGERLEVFVHGWEQFVYAPDFDFSGSELLITLTFAPQGEGAWTLFRTDEVTEAEYHACLP